MARVLDSSAVLAVLQGEPGAEMVLAALPECVLSAVNLSEVMRVLLRKGVPLVVARRGLARLQLSVVPFQHGDSEAVAIIGQEAPHLSLGDCACLALARSLGASDVLTSDQAWAHLDAGVKVTVIR